MKPKLKRRLAFILLGTATLVGALSCYVRTHPLVFNESFYGHAHCIVGGGLSLARYAGEHVGQFPSHPNGYGDALVLVNGGWDESLTGPGYNAQVFERVRRTGEDAPEEEFGRVYVQGLNESNDPNLVLLFDKLPTPGGDHCPLFRRFFAPLAREIWTIGCFHTAIQESDWPAFASHQMELLSAAGIPKAQAEKYYAAKPRK